MTARIFRNFEFQAGVHFSGSFYMNSYSIDVEFNVESESISEQNIALERIKYYLHDCLEHSVIVYETDENIIEKYLDAGLKVCTVPEQPYDQVVGIMLMLKLNAITEGRLIITDISIESRMSDGVSCLHSIEETVGPFIINGWWSDSSTKINNHRPKNKKIVKLNKQKNEWADVYLDWGENNIFTTQNGSTAEIVFASFDKTEK